MKKYTPSVKNNNQVKDELMQEMKAFLYRIEKGKYGKNLDKDTVKEVYDSLANAADGLGGIIFTGDEDLTMVNDKIGSCLANVKKALEQDYSNRLVEAADDLLYYNCTNITSITMNSEIKTIGAKAFENCAKLESADIGTGVTAINADAFKNCSALKSMVLPSSVTEVGSYAFYGCSNMASVTLSNLTKINDYTFYSCSSLAEIILPETLNEIGEYAFYDSGLTEISIPNGVTTIGGNAFGDVMGITDITLPNGLLIIGDKAFSNVQIKTVVVPNSVTSLGAGVFQGCPLESISLPFVGKSRDAVAYEAVFGYIFGYTTTAYSEYSSTYGGYLDSSKYRSNKSNEFVETQVLSVANTIWQYSCYSKHGKVGYNYYSGSDVYGYILESYLYYIPSTLTNVVITDATVIPEEAFYNCANITSVRYWISVVAVGQILSTG